MLRFVINKYDLTNPHLDNIKFQYRRIGDAWSTAFTYPKNKIAYDFIMEYWDVSQLPDGEYELRAVSDCGSKGVKYSSIASGVIDRSALIVTGTPQPSDKILNIGEDIYISFNGDVDAAFLGEDNVSLMCKEDSTYLNVTVTSYENTVYIEPDTSLSTFENRTLIVTVSDIRDIYGNRLLTPVKWEFRVNMNPVYWAGSNTATSVYQEKESSISATLKNAGAETGSFTITRHPQWLTPDVINGSIPPNGEQVIRFNVNSELSVGSYSDTVVVSTVQGEELFLVDLDVLIAPPDWSINPGDYTYTMNIIAQLFFDDSLSNDIYDIVAVQVGDEVRGIANLEYLPAIDQYMAFVTVYSNQVSGDILTFRMWDASKGKEFAYFGDGYSFTSNGVLGTVSNPLMIEPDANVQTFKFESGWNWFSLNVEKGNISVRNALDGLEPSDGDIIKGQDGFSQYYNKIGWHGSLRSLDPRSSYQIYLQNSDEISFTGRPVNIGTEIIELNKGWTWIANLNQNITDINDALSNISASDGDRIKSQTEFAIYTKDIDSWEGSLKNLTPGAGYMLYTAAGGDLNYPYLGKRSVILPEDPDWQLDYALFEYSMSVTAVVEFNEAELADSTLLVSAFKNEKCCGLGHPQYIEELDRYILFMPVYSNKAGGDSITFRVYDPETEKVREVKGKIPFVSNAILGDPGSPHVITAMPIGDELVPYSFYLNQNYPNPFNSGTTIEYGLPSDEKVKLFVYNTLGQKVLTLVNQNQKAGRYKLNFDASGKSIASGLYIYYLKAGSFEKRLKFIFIK